MSARPFVPVQTMHFKSAADAVTAMRDAGAAFTLHRRQDSLKSNFTYEIGAGGDREKCRAILRAVKQRPAPFFRAFREEVALVAVEAPDAARR